MSYFGFLGHFEKDRLFICWLSKKPYATGSAGLEPWNTEPTDKFPGVESALSYLWQWTSLPAMSPDFLSMPWKWPHWSPRYPETWGSHPGENRPAKAQRQMATWVPICNWNTNLFPVGITIEDNQGLRSLFKTHGWGPEWEDSATDSLCDIRQSWAALDVSLWVKRADWNSGSQGPSKSQCPWSRVW